ncbi:Tyrosine-protein kinase [Aphelenchoides besseyi]|nr:Tyrosine-protein kinase [Aphelenchoides besseyi]
MNNNTTPAVAQIGLSVPASQPQTPIAQSTVGTETELQRAPFFHGLLPREDIKTLLREPGEFLVRSTEPKSGEPRCFVLSVMLHPALEENGVRSIRPIISTIFQIKHFLINRVANNKFAIDSYCFDTIPRLVNYHLRQKVPVSRACSDSIIRRPVVRQSWELMHEDLEITKKLGEGAFGEVSFGRLRLPSGTKIDVAIKLAKLESMRKEQIKEIMNESRMMRPLDHPNVIKTYGVAALREPLLIVMEFITTGSSNSLDRRTDRGEMHDRTPDSSSKSRRRRAPLRGQEKELFDRRSRDKESSKERKRISHKDRKNHKNSGHQLKKSTR